jgi:uncharacterized 2Fe-2S/4Fe-4S cluster protein (DUF4445 family)
MERRHAIIFQPEGLRAEASTGDSVLIAAQRCGIPIDALCGGRGKCGKCTIRVGRGKATDPTPSEAEALSRAEMDRGLRLACQTYPVTDLVISIPMAPRPIGSKILTWGLELPVRLDPRLRTSSKQLMKPTLNDQLSDEARLRRAFKCRSIDLHLLRRLPSLVRGLGWNVAAVIYSDEIVDTRGADRSELYGVAVDVGTTTIVAYLIDLASGRVVAVESDYNAQIPYGEDVISRITYISREGGGLALMQRLLVETLNKLITRVAEKAVVDRGLIYEVVCAGNTIMMSMLLGIDPSQIATSPYIPPVTGGCVLKAREVGVEVSAGGHLRTVPSISGYVGADVVSDVLVSGMYRRRDLSMLIDIGTNGEVVLGNKDAMLSASCAAGPALEGAEIAFGMRGMAGAIERVAINAESHEVFYRTIGNERPRGICGSGLVDAMASLRVAGILDQTGRMRAEGQGSRREFVIARAAETDMGKDIIITQKDIRNLQLAKAAIFTGCSLLMREMGVEASALKKIFIAGAFGNYIDPLSAIIIGMFPDVPMGRIKSIGNGSGFGARLVLLSKRKGAEADEIAHKIHYVELSAEGNFQREFLKALNLPHAEGNLFPTAMRIIESKGRGRPKDGLEFEGAKR